MNTKLLIAFFLVLTLLQAQSDYEKVQNFKTAIQQIEKSIEQVKTVEALDSLESALQSLLTKYSDDVELLDKSLYPDDYKTTYQKVQNQITSRRVKITNVGMLEAKVVSLQNQLDDLNKENTRLLGQIQEYQRVGGSDKASVNELRRMVSDLRTKLKQRDELVRSIVDSLLSDYVTHPMTLNDAEKQDVYEKVETGNLFYNVEKTVRDNMEFLKVSEFTPEQLNEIKEDQVDFYSMWQRVGPRLADLYREQGDQTGEVAYITNLFSEWEQKVDERILERIRQVLRDEKVELSPFTSGEEFVNSLTSYIDEQTADATEVEFKQFRDSVWVNELRPNWIPLLVDNEMISLADKKTIQKGIDDWEAKFDTETPYYWYVLIGFILLILFLVFIPKWRGKNKPLSEQ